MKRHWRKEVQNTSTSIKKILNISFDLIGDMIYKENFDLGDKCDIILKNMGEYQSRIIGINETVKEKQKGNKRYFRG